MNSLRKTTNATTEKIITFCSAFWRKLFNFYASQSA